MKEQGAKIVLSSSANKKYIEEFLTKYEMRDFFDYLFTGESCSYTKPDEKFYLNIKKHYEGYNIFVVEDSDNGLIAAFNAGLQTLFYNAYGQTTCAPYHYVVTKLSQIHKVIVDYANYGYFIRNTNIDIVIENIHPTFSAKEKKIIEDIWNGRPEHIFNGKVLACNSIKYRRGRLIVECYVTEYKYVYSIRSKITPVAVSGICIDSNDNIIVSVRNKVTDYAGYYELIPSGGIDKRYVEGNRQGYKEQLLVELCEEGGIMLKENVVGIDTLGVCYDAGSNTIDICMKIQCGIDFMSVILDDNNDEYSSMTILIDKLNSIKEVLKDKEVVMTSRMILKNINGNKV